MTGALIAITIKQPYAAMPLAVASHFICDAIPHFGFREKYVFTKRFNAFLLADFVLAVVLMGILGHLFPVQRWLVWACMVLAASPDLMWLYYRGYVQHIRKQSVTLDPVAKFHAAIQWSQTVPGGIYEIMWFAVIGAVFLAVRYQ